MARVQGGDRFRYWWSHPFAWYHNLSQTTPQKGAKSAVELDELKRVIVSTDPAAVLVAPRILRRVLQAQFNVPYLLVHVPHERCYVFDRQVVFQAVEQDELELEPDPLLPPILILLARPSLDELQAP